MHPMLKDGVTIGTYTHRQTGELCYFAENAEGELFRISQPVYNALMSADGTKPLALPDKGRHLLPTLKKHGVVHTSRFVRSGGLFNRFILLPFSEHLADATPLWRIIAAVLPVLSISVFLLGLVLMLVFGMQSHAEFNTLLYVVLCLLSLALHEVGHLSVGLAFHYSICDAGILLLGIFPIGAYVAHEEKPDATWSEQARFALAGVEMNLLLAGLFLLLAMLPGPLSCTLANAANLNVLLVLLNLLPAAGLDGEKVLSALFRVPSITSLACSSLFRWRRLKRLLRSGPAGYICLLIFVPTLLSNIVLWGLFLVEPVLALWSLF